MQPPFYLINMTPLKQLILIFIIIIIFLIQSSHPSAISFYDIVPNMLFCNIAALLLVFNYKNVWQITLFAAVMLEINTSMTWGIMTLSLFTLALLTVRLKKLFVDKIISFTIIPFVISLAYSGLTILIALFWLGIDLTIIAQIISSQTIYELAMHYLIILLFIGLYELLLSRKKSSLEFHLNN